MRLRSKARELALCFLYQTEISKADFGTTLTEYSQNHPKKPDVIEFFSFLVKGVADNLIAIDSIIKKYTKNWQIERMAIIDRNILRIACFELLYIDDIPPKVSINEAIELAKRFGDLDSPRFVNGLLDKVYKMEGSKKDDLHSEE